MKYLFSYWERVRKTLKGKHVYLFLDYDGTLTPIVKTPNKAFMPKKTRKLLRHLSGMPNYKLAIISGRALCDIKRKVGLKNNIVYVGNHGFEINGPRIKFKSPVPLKYRWALEKIKAELQKRLSSVRGILIEDKGFSLSLHYRLVDKKNISKVKTEFYAALILYEVRNDVSVRTGKKVLEIRPPIAWDKGKVVMWLLARHKFAIGPKKKEVLPIYIGDDKTDEDAFESLKGRGITIFVGKPKKTEAQFYLKDPQDVARFLGAILKS